MNDKYQNTFLKNAEKLDLTTSQNGEVVLLANRIVNSCDAEATKAICSLLGKIHDEFPDSNKVRQMLIELKDSLISYYGYLRITEILGNKPTNEQEDNYTLTDLLNELNELTGLKKVKDKVNDLIAFQTVQKLRREQGLNISKNTMHLAFTGNPGTGKTTVARIVGRIYKQLGLLSKGHFIEVSRTDLIAGYQGQTALKVKKVVEKAKGGVLFIDEAYSITENENSDSYGRECLTELTKALEDYRDDLVVIVAGYTEPMDKFFESNPGLKSRFNTFIEFDDYNETELFDILVLLCKKNNYTLTRSAEEKIKEVLSYYVKNKTEHFANGRLTRNIFDDLIMNQAKRVVSINNPSKSELTDITAEDVNTMLKTRIRSSPN
ncbi:MAG: AAA family ATPase [Ruminococcus sp.]